MKILLSIVFVLLSLVDASMIHNLGGPLATYPNAQHLYDLAFFFSLENTIPSHVFVKIQNPAGFAFQPTNCNYGIITAEKALQPPTGTLKCEITSIGQSTYINFLKVDQTTKVGLAKNTQYGIWLQDNILQTSDGSYGPFNVTIVSTNVAVKVQHEIVYDSNYEFGYIIVGTLGTPLSVTLARDSTVDNDVFGASFNAIVTIASPPVVTKPFRMRLKWSKSNGYIMGGNCIASIFGTGDMSQDGVSSVLNCQVDSEGLAEIKVRLPTPTNITKIQFSFISQNPAFLHSNGIKLWMIEEKSEKIIAYGETSSQGLGMRATIMPASVLSVNSGWGVPITTDSDLFQFYQTNDECDGGTQGTPNIYCATSNTALLSITLPVANPVNSKFIISLTGTAAALEIVEFTETSLQTIGLIYPASVNHDFPEYQSVKPRCTASSRISITCNGVPALIVGTAYEIRFRFALLPDKQVTLQSMGIQLEIQTRNVITNTWGTLMSTENTFKVSKVFKTDGNDFQKLHANYNHQNSGSTYYSLIGTLNGANQQYIYPSAANQTLSLKLTDPGIYNATTQDDAKISLYMNPASVTAYTGSTCDNSLITNAAKCTFTKVNDALYTEITATWQDLSGAGSTDNAAVAFPGSDTVVTLQFINLVINSFEPIFAGSQSMDIFFKFRQGTTVKSTGLINGYTVSSDQTLVKWDAGVGYWYQDTADTNDGSEIPYFLRLKGYLTQPTTVKKIALFFPLGQPFYIDEDPAITGNYHQVNCGTNYANVTCNYFGNGNVQYWQTAKGYFSNVFIIDLTNLQLNTSSASPLEVAIPMAGSSWTVATANINFYIAELDKDDVITNLKIQAPPGSPGYGAASAITDIPVNVNSYFAIKKSGSVDLVMNTIITEALIQFKESTYSITDANEIFVGSGLIYCSDFSMWSSDNFTSHRYNNLTNACLKVKYWISSLGTPRYHYCIYCPSAYTGIPYDKSGSNLDQTIILKNVYLPSTDDLMIRNGFAGWSNGKGKAIFRKTQSSEVNDVKMMGQRIIDFSMRPNILNINQKAQTLELNMYLVTQVPANGFLILTVQNSIDLQFNLENGTEASCQIKRNNILISLCTTVKIAQELQIQILSTLVPGNYSFQINQFSPTLTANNSEVQVSCRTCINVLCGAGELIDNYPSIDNGTSVYTQSITFSGTVVTGLVYKDIVISPKNITSFGCLNFMQQVTGIELGYSMTLQTYFGTGGVMAAVIDAEVGDSWTCQPRTHDDIDWFYDFETCQRNKGNIQLIPIGSIFANRQTRVKLCNFKIPPLSYGLYGNLRITGETLDLALVDRQQSISLGNLGSYITNGTLKELYLSKTFLGTGAISKFNITFKSMITPVNKTNMVDVTLPSYYPDNVAESLSCEIGSSTHSFEGTNCFIDTFNPRLIHVLGPLTIEFAAQEAIEIHIQGIVGVLRDNTKPELIIVGILNKTLGSIMVEFKSVADIVTNTQVGRALEILDISVIDNHEQLATDIQIKFMSPVKNQIALLYIDLNLPNQYEPMLQLYGTYGCSLKNVEGQIFASSCSIKASQVSMKVIGQTFKQEIMIFEVRRIVNPKVDGVNIFEMIQMGISENQNQTYDFISDVNFFNFDLPMIIKSEGQKQMYFTDINGNKITGQVVSTRGTLDLQVCYTAGNFDWLKRLTMVSNDPKFMILDSLKTTFATNSTCFRIVTLSSTQARSFKIQLLKIEEPPIQYTNLPFLDIVVKKDPIFIQITGLHILCVHNNRATPFKIEFPGSPYNDVSITISSNSTDLYINQATKKANRYTNYFYFDSISCISSIRQDQYINLTLSGTQADSYRFTETQMTVTFKEPKNQVANVPKFTYNNVTSTPTKSNIVTGCTRLGGQYVYVRLNQSKVFQRSREYIFNQAMQSLNYDKDLPFDEQFFYFTMSNQVTNQETQMRTKAGEEYIVSLYCKDLYGDIQSTDFSFKTPSNSAKLFQLSINSQNSISPSDKTKFMCFLSQELKLSEKRIFTDGAAQCSKSAPDTSISQRKVGTDVPEFSLIGATTPQDASTFNIVFLPERDIDQDIAFQKVQNFSRYEDLYKNETGKSKLLEILPAFGNVNSQFIQELSDQQPILRNNFSIAISYNNISLDFVANFTGYIYVQFFKFDNQPNATADLIEFNAAKIKATEDLKIAILYNLPTSHLIDPKDIYLKNDSYYENKFKSQLADVSHTFTYRNVESSLEKMIRLDIAMNQTQHLEFKGLDTGSYYGTYIIASNENLVMKNAKWAEMETILIQTLTVKSGYSLIFTWAIILSFILHILF